MGVIVFLVASAAAACLTWWLNSGLSVTERRFLGTWSIPETAWELVVTFHEDGTFTRETGPPGRPSNGYWHVDGSKLVMVHRLGTWLQSGGRLRYTAAKFGDPKMIESMSEKLEIISIEADTIRLRGSKDIEFIRTDPAAIAPSPP